MQVYSIPISRPLKRVITASWDVVLLGVALIFSFALSAGAFFQQAQATLIALALPLLLPLASWSI